MSNQDDFIDSKEQPLTPEPENTIALLAEELETITNRLNAEIVNTPLTNIPETFEGMADDYVAVNQLYKNIKSIHETLGHSREALRLVLLRAMETRAVSSVISTDGSRISDRRTIYAKVIDRSAFVNWVRETGMDDLVEFRERKGSAQNPGLDHVVRDAVKRARERGKNADEVLPVGVSYSERVNLVVTTPSQGDMFDGGAQGIIARLKERTESENL